MNLFTAEEAEEVLALPFGEATDVEVRASQTILHLYAKLEQLSKPPTVLTAESISQKGLPIC